MILKTIVGIWSFSILAGCAAEAGKQNSVGPAPNSEVGVVRSEVERNQAPEVPDEDINRLVRGNTEFACNLFARLRNGEGNIVFSPFSISQALAMTWAGGEGETESEMAKALSFTLDPERFHPAFNALDLSLSSQPDAKDGSFRFNLVNALWGRDDISYKQPFLDLLARNYGAGMRICDFKNEPEQTRKTINSWVEEETYGKIEDLLPRGSIDASTALVLTNAIYFYADWASQFKKSSTRSATFHPLEGDSITVEMMHQTGMFEYGEGEVWKAIRMRYAGGRFAAVFVLPQSGEYKNIENSLDADFYGSVLDSLQESNVEVALPRFEIKGAGISLKSPLVGLGMERAFTGRADFSGITEETKLNISDVLHKAFVRFDEKGTEAAAATAVNMKALSAVVTDVRTFTADRPFLFFIQDTETEAVLFMGRVLEP